jgi:hypothetical protein
MEEQFDPIPIDFGVKLLSKVHEEGLYGKAKGLLIHFVFTSNNDSSNTIDQAYVHRHELAQSIINFQETGNAESISIKLSGGLTMVMSKTDNDLNINIQWINSNTSFSITRKRNNVLNCLFKDIETIRDIRKKPDHDKDFGIDLVQEIVGEKKVMNNFKHLLTVDFELMAFESTMKKKPFYSISKIYKTAMNSDLSNIDSLKELLLQNFEFVHKITSCDCGDPGCFFDILKANQLAFFSDNYFSEGAFNSGLVAEKFSNLWNELDFRSKVVLAYLSDEFWNSTLLNLAFLRPEFNLNNYQFLMTYTDQPDSEQDEFIRSVTTTAQYFFRLYSKTTIFSK